MGERQKKRIITDYTIGRPNKKKNKSTRLNRVCVMENVLPLFT